MKKFLIGRRLGSEQVALMKAFTKDCRGMILEMLRLPQSGHPGGSLSSIDFLALLYAGIVANTGEKVVISNGHISPAVYSVLAELGWADREALLKDFRRAGSPFEGHVSRLVVGVEYGTGPLGIGVGVAAGMAWAERQKKSPKKVYAIMGDGEAEEGEVYEMMNFAAAHKLDNLIVICDYNGVQLTDAISRTLPNNMIGHFRAAGWLVLEVDGHDLRKLWRAYGRAQKSGGKPVLIVAKTLMGKGVAFMEVEGRARRATWHGKAPSPEQIDGVLKKFHLKPKEQKSLNEFRKTVTRRPAKPQLNWPVSNAVRVGKPVLYGTEKETDCRSAYGRALVELAGLNPRIVALTADLRESVKTGLLAEKYPARYIECGIAEQFMVSMAGGLSLSGYIPFVSTYAVFMTSRAKDQARVNDVNNTNVKMVVTHAGLSVGEDGPTHQSVDDNGSMLGLFNTKIIEPADPNQTDRVIRFLAKHDGNYYVRMGRHKYPVITDRRGKPFYNLNYKYSYGRTDLIRSGKKLTVVAIGPMVHEALLAWEKLAAKGKAFDLIAASSIKLFDRTLLTSMKKTGQVLTVEEHNLHSGLYAQIACLLQEKVVKARLIGGLGVKNYQSSGKSEDLYLKAGIKAENIVRYIDKLIK